MVCQGAGMVLVRGEGGGGGWGALLWLQLKVGRSSSWSRGLCACKWQEGVEQREEGEEEIAAESGGRSPTQQRVLFSPPCLFCGLIEGTSCVVFVAPLRERLRLPSRPPSDLYINTPRRERWMGRSSSNTRAKGNPGNNMRTLSLSRTLAEDLHCCRLP